jgi:hypothetical protein
MDRRESPVWIDRSGTIEKIAPSWCSTAPAIAVIEKLAETVGMLGTLVLIGGAPAGARFSLDHLATLWSKRVIGVLGGGGRSGQLIPGLAELLGSDAFRSTAS